MPALDAIINRVTKFVLAGDPGDLALAIPSSDTFAPPPAQTNEEPRKGKRGALGTGIASTSALGTDGKDRLAKYQDMRKIDLEIPEASSALDAIMTNTTSGEPGNEVAGFVLEFDEGFAEEGQQAATDLVDRIKLHQELPKVVRSACKLGDVASHLTIDRQGIIWGPKNLVPDLLFRNHDAYDRLRNWVYRGYDSDGEVLNPWEVVHYAHAPELGALFGRALFEGGRDLAYKLMGVRDGGVFQAVNHAASRSLIAVGRSYTMSDPDRDAWLDRQYEAISRRKNINSAGTLDRRMVQVLDDQHILIDYVVNMDGKGPEPKVFSLGAADIAQVVAMMEHLQDLWCVLIKVPKAFIGIERSGEGLGGDRLSTQEIEFAKFLNGEQVGAARYGLEIIARQLAFLGIPLPRGAIQFVMPDLRALDKKMRAEVLYISMQAAKIADELGLPFKYIWCELLFDGDHAQAEEAAARYGINLDTRDEERAAQVATQQAAMLAAQQASGNVNGDGKPIPPKDAGTQAQVEHLLGDVARVRAGIAAVRGRRVSNAGSLGR